MYFFSLQKHLYKALAHIGYYTFYRSASEYAIVVGNVFDKLAELGNFWISIGSEGAEDLKKFTESNITAVNIVFTPGEDFQNLRSRAAFNPVASRIAQAATLKAEKAGKGTVDLNAAKGKTPASTNENNPSL